MKFNPPPTWPVPPSPWTPPEGWTPDPTWPLAPPGWQLWLPDEAPPGTPRWPSWTFWVGAAVFVAVAVSMKLVATSGGVLWWGGLIVGASLMIRTFVAHRGAGHRFPPAAWAAMAVAIVLCLGSGVVAVTALVTTGNLHEAVGSCWKADDSGENVELVDCGSGHEYRAAAHADADTDCPADSLGSITADGGGVWCLVED